MIIHDLPHYPVIITSKNNAKGHAVMVTDYGFEHPKIWGVVMEDTGEFWELPSAEIRFCWNFTLGRRKPS